MKHIALKSLLSVALSLMMLVVFIPTIAFADEPEAADETQAVQPAVEDEFVDEDTEAPAEDLDVDTDSLDLNKGAGLSKEASYAFFVNPVSTLNEMFGEESEMSEAAFTKEDTSVNGYYCVQEVEIESGVLGIVAAMYANTEKLTAKAKIGLFYDKNCKKPVDGYMTIKESRMSEDETGTITTCYFKVPKTRTYYLAVGVPKKGWSTAENMKVMFYAWRFAKAKSGTTLKTGYIYGVRSGKGKTTTFKYTPEVTGAVEAVTFMPGVGGQYPTNKVKTKIKSSSGKVLGAQASTKYPAVFGIKANRKYKISCTTYKKATDRGYVIFVIAGSEPNQSGVSKAKATVIEKGDNKSGLIIAGSKKAQWFQFTKDTDFPTNVTCRGLTNNKFKVQLYKGKKVLKTAYITQSKMQQEIKILDSVNLQTGTYYLKVTPIKKSSGFYSIGWSDVLLQ